MLNIDTGTSSLTKIVLQDYIKYILNKWKIKFEQKKKCNFLL